MKSAEALKMEYLEKNKQVDARLAQMVLEKNRLDVEKNQLDVEKNRLDVEKSKLQENIKSFSDRIVAIVKKLYAMPCPVEEISETVGISQSDVRNILGLAN